MFKLVLEKAEEPEIKLPTSAGSSKKEEFQKNIYFCFIDYAKAFNCVDYNKLWKILKEMGIPDHLTCLLRNLYTGQEATVRTGHGTTDWFQIGKGVRQGCMAPHSSTLAWKIPWMEEPGRLQSMGPHRVRHDWSDLAAAAGNLDSSLCLFQPSISHGVLCIEVQ